MLSFIEALERAERAWERRERPLAERSREVYRTNLRRLAHEVPLQVDGQLLPVSRLQKNLEAWRNRQRQAKASADKIRGDRFAMIAFFRPLVPRYLTSNPAETIVGAPHPQRQPRPIKDRKILDALFEQADSLQTNCLFDLFYGHGLRNIEVCRLSLNDIELQGDMITLHVTGKGGRVREAEIVDTAVQSRLLRHVLTLHNESFPRNVSLDALRRRTRDMFESDEPLFRRANGQRYTPRRIADVFAAHRDRAELPKKIGGSAFGAHTLRHTFGSDLINSGTDIRVTQDLMGHGSIRTTEQYTFVNQTAKRQAMARLRIPRGL